MTKQQLQESIKVKDALISVLADDIRDLLLWYDKRMGNDYYDPNGGDEIWKRVRERYVSI